MYAAVTALDLEAMHALMLRLPGYKGQAKPDPKDNEGLARVLDIPLEVCPLFASVAAQHAYVFGHFA